MQIEQTTCELAVQLGDAAQKAGLLIATAESCTAGGVAFEITSIPGSSAWVDRGFVTYTNEAKEQMLGVSHETLQTYGAVSEETAREMACGAIAHSRARAAVSVTGIAGPGGAVPGKPVGTVCFAAAVECGSSISVRSFREEFSGNRDAVRRQSIDYAMFRLLELIDGTTRSLTKNQ